MKKSIDLLVVDQTVCYRGRVPLTVAGAAVGALSADPYTWDELKAAMGRFISSAEMNHGFELTDLDGLVPASTGNANVHRQPDCLIDLSGRRLVTRWNQMDDPIPAQITRSEASDTLPARYHIGQCWEISSNFDDWLQETERRRSAHANRASTDVRTTLYGTAMLTFLARECATLKEASRASQVAVENDQRPVTRNDEPRQQIMRNVFSKWLKECHESLEGRSVEEVLTDDLEHLARDLQHREAEWSRFGQPSVSLRESDTAYRVAGIGPHESLLYDQLVYTLLYDCLARMEGTTDDAEDLEAAVAWLRERRDQWLWLADEENLMGKSPREVIDLERRRIPLVVEDAHDVLHDDCPLCQMMASDESGPMFWHLDSCFDAFGIDDDEEDDEEDDDEAPIESEVDSTDRKNEDTESDRNESPRPVDHSSVSSATEVRSMQPSTMPSIWQRVCIMTKPGESSIEIDLFTVAACTGELIEDLKDRKADRSMVDSLNRHASNMCSAIRGTESSLVGPVVARFCECLDDVESQFEELAGKVADLQSRLVSIDQKGTDG